MNPRSPHRVVRPLLLLLLAACLSSCVFCGPFPHHGGGWGHGGGWHHGHCR